MTRFSAFRLAAACAVAFAATSAAAADFNFNSAPFAGVDVSAPTGQIVGNELFITNFSPAGDRFVFDAGVFGVGALSFFNGTAATLPASGFNVIVLQDNDNDNNLATAFGAGTAANLIAARINQAGAGFFIYTNQGLGVNRLVYSTNLDDPTADLKILARLTQSTGADAITAKADFGSQNFALAPVPEPETYAFMLSGLLTLGWVARRKRRATSPAA